MLGRLPADQNQLLYEQCRERYVAKKQLPIPLPSDGRSQAIAVEDFAVMPCADFRVRGFVGILYRYLTKGRDPSPAFFSTL